MAALEKWCSDISRRETKGIHHKTKRAISPSTKAFLKKELSATTRFGVTLTRPERIQSAKARLQTKLDTHSKDGNACDTNNSFGVLPSNVVTKDSSKKGKMYRRPRSAVSASLAKDKPRQTQKTKTDGAPIHPLEGRDNSCLTFEIHGAAIPNPSPVASKNSHGLCRSKRSASLENTQVLPLTEGKVLNQSTNRVPLTCEMSDPEPDVSGVEGSCFLTEARDESEDIEMIHLPVQDTKCGIDETRLNRHRSKTSLVCEPCAQGVESSAVKSAKNWFSVKPCLYSMQLEEDEGEMRACKAMDREDAADFPFKLLPKEEMSLVPVPALCDLRKKTVCNTHLGRPLPETLGPLGEFICTEDDDKKLCYMTGVSSDNCLVFLPDLESYDISVLEEVPSVQHVDDDLPYKEKLLSPRPWAPKKYSHSFKPTATPKWECNHVKGHLSDNRYTNRDPKREIELVRKEITELEQLLKGIGFSDSECLLSRYQADVTQLQKTLQDTLRKCPERAIPTEKPDHFGLRKFYRQHDAVIKRIRDQHAVCVKELAKLEEEADLLDGQKHFSKHDYEVSLYDQSG